MVIQREFKGTLDFKLLIGYELEKELDKFIEKKNEVQYNNSQVGIIANENLTEAVI